MVGELKHEVSPGGGGASWLRRSTFCDDESTDGAFPLSLDPGNDAFLVKHVVAGGDGDELFGLEIFQTNGAPLPFFVVGRGGFVA